MFECVFIAGLGAAPAFIGRLGHRGVGARLASRLFRFHVFFNSTVVLVLQGDVCHEMGRKKGRGEWTKIRGRRESYNWNFTYQICYVNVLICGKYVTIILCSNNHCSPDLSSASIKANPL